LENINKCLAGTDRGCLAPLICAGFVRLDLWESPYLHGADEQHLPANFSVF